MKNQRPRFDQSQRIDQMRQTFLPIHSMGEGRGEGIFNFYLHLNLLRRVKDLLNKTNSKVSMSGVNWLKQILVLLLLATWLPAANHCFLEAAGLVSDECDTTQNATTPSSDPCDTGCKLAEQTGFKVTQQKFHAPIPLVIAFMEIPEHLPEFFVRRPMQNWPSENFRLPQFVLATALPIRAPAFVS